MIRRLVVALAASGLLIAGCSQEQKPAPSQPQTDVKPAAAPAVPATPTPIAAPSKPAEPAAPKAATASPAPTKPAVKLPAAPDTVTLTASQGAVTLPHLAHAKLFPCASCHGDGIPGKIALDKETAHALCRDCHQSRGTGPTACSGCHKK